MTTGEGTGQRPTTAELVAGLVTARSEAKLSVCEHLVGDGAARDAVWRLHLGTLRCLLCAGQPSRIGRGICVGCGHMDRVATEVRSLGTVEPFGRVAVVYGICRFCTRDQATITQPVQRIR